MQPENKNTATQTSKLDWRFAENETTWQTAIENHEQATNISGAPVKTAGWRAKHYWIITLLCALLTVAVSLASYRLYQKSTQQIAEIQQELQATVDAESLAWQGNDPSHSATFWDRSAPLAWVNSSLLQQEWLRQEAGAKAETPVIRVKDVELYDDLALVTTEVEDSGLPWLAQPFGEHRFYRQVYGQWLRTAPDSIFWGAQDQLTTAHFIFSFSRRDAEAVNHIAANVNLMYIAMRQEMALPEPPAGQKIRVEVVRLPDRHYDLLYRAISAEQARAVPLSAANLNLSQLQSTCSWQSPLSAAQEQDSHCLEALPIHFTETILQVPSPTLLPLPSGVSEAEALSQTLAHTLAGRVLDEALMGQKIKTNWLQVIQGVRLWLGCHGASQPFSWLYLMDEVVHEQVTHEATLQMMHGTTTITYHADMRILSASTLVAYAVKRYGPQSLPALVAALSRYESWQTLIPAVYGVPPAQFEQEWQESLK